MVKVSIITVGMNHIRFIRHLYHTLFDLYRPTVDFEAIYVDNCSEDGSVKWLRDAYPEVKIIQNEKIKGFGENNDIGVKASEGRYVAFINPDIEFIDDAIDKLYQCAEEQGDSFGVMAPKLLNPNNTVQYSARNFMTFRAFLGRVFSCGNDRATNVFVKRYLCKDIERNKLIPVNWVMGAAMFMRRDFYDEVGGFDLDYFLYMEDEDLCYRSWKMGKQVLYCGHVAVTHNHQRASRKFGKKMLIHLWSLFTFFRKHGWNIRNQVPKAAR